MGSASPVSLALARRLLALEAAQGRRSGALRSGGGAARQADDVVLVCEKLRTVLTAFVGAAGFRSLLARALMLAKAEEPSLGGLHVLEDGSLAGFEKVRGEAGGGARAGSGRVFLVAHLLDLLVIFIGEPLTLRLVLSAWSDVPAGLLVSTSGDTP